MATKQNLEEAGTSIFHNFLHKLKPIHIAYALVPLVIIYPKPLMLILKPIIRNWSFYYKNISEVANKPAEIVLTSDPSMGFTKEYLKNLKVIKGTLPQGFKLIRQSIIKQQQLRHNEDESMKHIFYQTRHEFQKERIFRSCYVIDMQEIYQPKIVKNKFQTSAILNQRKNSHTQKSTEDTDISMNSIYTEIDYVWVEMILMKLKVLQLENNSEVIKHVIIKANEKVLQLLESKILGIKESQAFKLGTIGPNKIHLLKLNKNLDTYEQCSTTFKIQSTQSISQKLNQS